MRFGREHAIRIDVQVVPSLASELISLLTADMAPPSDGENTTEFADYLQEAWGTGSQPAAVSQTASDPQPPVWQPGLQSFLVLEQHPEAELPEATPPSVQCPDIPEKAHAAPPGAADEPPPEPMPQAAVPAALPHMQWMVRPETARKDEPEEPARAQDPTPSAPGTVTVEREPAAALPPRLESVNTEAHAPMNPPENDPPEPAVIAPRRWDSAGPDAVQPAERHEPEAAAIVPPTPRGAITRPQRLDSAAPDPIQPAERDEPEAVAIVPPTPRGAIARPQRLDSPPTDLIQPTERDEPDPSAIVPSTPWSSIPELERVGGPPLSAPETASPMPSSVSDLPAESARPYIAPPVTLQTPRMDDATPATTPEVVVPRIRSFDHQATGDTSVRFHAPAHTAPDRDFDPRSEMAHPSRAVPLTEPHARGESDAAEPGVPLMPPVSFQRPTEVERSASPEATERPPQPQASPAQIAPATRPSTDATDASVAWRIEAPSPRESFDEPRPLIQREPAAVPADNSNPPSPSTGSPTPAQDWRPAPHVAFAGTVERAPEQPAPVLHARMPVDVQEQPQTPVRTLTVTVEQQAGADRTDIHFTHRNGAVDMVVRSSSAETARTLRSELPELVRSLEENGFHSDLERDQRDRHGHSRRQYERTDDDD